MSDDPSKAVVIVYRHNKEAMEKLQAENDLLRTMLYKALEERDAALAFIDKIPSYEA